MLFVPAKLNRPGGKPSSVFRLMVTAAEASEPISPDTCVRSSCTSPLVASTVTLGAAGSGGGPALALLAELLDEALEELLAELLDDALDELLDEALLELLDEAVLAVPNTSRCWPTEILAAVSALPTPCANTTVLGPRLTVTSRVRNSKGNAPGRNQVAACKVNESPLRAVTVPLI